MRARHFLGPDRDEAHRLKPLGGQPSFGSLRELARVVGNDGAIEMDTNATPGPCGAAAKSTRRDGLLRSSPRKKCKSVPGPTERVGRRELILDAAERQRGQAASTLREIATRTMCITQVSKASRARAVL